MSDKTIEDLFEKLGQTRAEVAFISKENKDIKSYFTKWVVIVVILEIINIIVHYGFIIRNG